VWNRIIRALRSHCLGLRLCPGTLCTFNTGKVECDWAVLPKCQGVSRPDYFPENQPRRIVFSPDENLFGTAPTRVLCRSVFQQSSVSICADMRATELRVNNPDCMYVSVLIRYKRQQLAASGSLVGLCSAETPDTNPHLSSLNHLKYIRTN
jgi:hypothetical protein